MSDTWPLETTRGGLRGLIASISTIASDPRYAVWPPFPLSFLLTCMAAMPPVPQDLCNVFHYCGASQDVRGIRVEVGKGHSTWMGVLGPPSLQRGHGCVPLGKGLPSSLQLQPTVLPTFPMPSWPRLSVAAALRQCQSWSLAAL